MGKLVGERRALAAAVLGFYMSIYFLVSLSAPGGWGAAFGGLAGVYAVAFVGLVAGYFWARWFAIGVGISGLVSGALSIWQIGPEPLLVFYGATHAVAALALWGGRMAEAFDGRSDWRDRFHMDENATHRLGKSVIRVGVSLPYIVLYALAPRDGAGTAIAALALAAAGAYGLARLRTWGVFALAGAAVTAAASAAGALPATASGVGLDVAGLGLAAGILLAAAAAPFAGPMVRYLRARG
ncbi:MAG: hypothetical protein D6689_21945 [Deltaproteobacteria bacterium]|nr:MAG: hypothetical protein D6689_21945 [Deltaproteobacteria bacterium]